MKSKLPEKKPHNIVVNLLKEKELETKTTIKSNSYEKRGEDVVEEYTKRVYLAGVGYTASLVKEEGKEFLNLKLGYSDIKRIEIPVTELKVLIVDRSIFAMSAQSAAVSTSNTKSKQSTKTEFDSPIKLVIILRGKSKESVNSFAAKLRQLRPLSRYKLIGISLNLNNKLKEKTKSTK